MMKRSSTLLLVLALFAGANARILLSDAFVCPGVGLFGAGSCTSEYYNCAAAGETAPLQSCAEGTVFNSAISGCDYRNNVAECPYDPTKCPGAGNFAFNMTCESSFWACAAFGADPTVMSCAEGTYFNAYTSQCDYKENVPDCNGECITVTYAAKATPQYSLLSAALAATGLDAVLDNSTLEVTVFAPDNAAFIDLFKALNVTAEEALAKGNLKTVEKILLTHVVPALVMAADLSANQTLPTLNRKQTLTVDLETEGVVKIQPGGGPAATVVVADLAVCKSIGHLIDTVLLPSNL